MTKRMRWPQRWLDLIRFWEWYDTKLPLLVMVAYYALLLRQENKIIEPLTRTVVYGATLLAFGYLVNDLCDQAGDLRVGKHRVIHSLPQWLGWGICGLSLGLSVIALLPYLHQFRTLLLFIISFIIAAGYSMPPMRFKEHGQWGLVAASAGQRVLPGLTIASALGALTWGTAWLNFAFLLMGLRYIVVHQALDIDNDRKAGVRTFMLEDGRLVRLPHLLNTIFLIELAVLTTLPLFLGRSFYWLAFMILPYTAYWTFRAIHNRQGSGFVAPITFQQMPLQTAYFLAMPASLLIALIIHTSSALLLIPIEIIWKSRLLWLHANVRDTSKRD